jgi:hypothetical protein
MSIPQPLIDLINKTDPNFIGFAYALVVSPGANPKTVFLPIRISASADFKTFRVEQLVRTNKDNYNPRGSWTTLSTHGSETGGQMLRTACEAFFKSRKDFIDKLNNRVQVNAKKLLRA